MVHVVTRLSIWLAVGACTLGGQFALGQGGEDPEIDKDDSIPDKVGAEVHLDKKERTLLKKLDCDMCKAIIVEMHNEVIKHDMTKKGVGSETQVWETQNAICLALLQRYKIDLESEKLLKKAEDEDDMMGGGGDPAKAMRGMLTLKMGCQRWLEDYGGDTSGFIFKVIKEGSHNAAAASQDFCKRKVNLCGKAKKENQKREREDQKQRTNKRKELRAAEDVKIKKATADDPFSALPEDSKAGLQRMLEMAKDDPFHYMEDEAKQRVQRGRADAQCEVCRIVLEDVHSQVASRPKSMQKEYDVLPLVEGACEGGKDLSVPNYFGIEPPPLPPTWTDRHRPVLDKKLDKYQVRRFPKKAEKKRKEWRALSPEGKQKPPAQGESEGDMMLTMSCKDVLDPARMSEVLVKEMGASSPEPALATARQVCKTVAGTTCEYAVVGVHGEPGGSKTADGKGHEL